jgi:hypothetical protein
VAAWPAEAAAPAAACAACAARFDADWALRAAAIAVSAALAAPRAAVAASFAAAADLFTSFWAAAASSAAFSAASSALRAASLARVEAATACSVCSFARLPSRTTTLTSCSIDEASSSRVRAMCWPETRNWWTARGDPSPRARSAYFFTSGVAVVRMAKTSAFSSSYCAVCHVSPRNFRKAAWVPVSSALAASLLTAVPLLSMTVKTSARRSVSRDCR